MILDTNALSAAADDDPAGAAILAAIEQMAIPVIVLEKATLMCLNVAFTYADNTYFLLPKCGAGAPARQRPTAKDPSQDRHQGGLESSHS